MVSLARSLDSGCSLALPTPARTNVLLGGFR